MPTRPCSARTRLRCAASTSTVSPRVVFASDAPFDPKRMTLYIRETIAVIVDRLPISDDDRERIYWRNAAAMLKLDD